MNLAARSTGPERPGGPQSARTTALFIGCAGFNCSWNRRNLRRLECRWLHRRLPHGKQRVSRGGRSGAEPGGPDAAVAACHGSTVMR